MTVQTAAIIYGCTALVSSLFQLALAAGLPWGAASFGGKFPGKYPPKMRLIALINGLVLCFFAFVVLSKANLVLSQLASFSQFAIWAVVAFGAISTLLNIITPSKIERIWAPIAAIQLITSIIVAIN